MKLQAVQEGEALDEKDIERQLRDHKGDYRHMDAW